MYQDFIALLGTKRRQSESFQNFATRFEAQVSKFSSHCDSVKSPEASTAFMLLAESMAENTQRISVIAASAQNDSLLSDTGTTADYLEAMKYRSISAVLRQCDPSHAGSSVDAPRKPAAFQVNAAKNV